MASDTGHRTPAGVRAASVFYSPLTYGGIPGRPRPETLLYCTHTAAQSMTETVLITMFITYLYETNIHMNIFSVNIKVENFSQWLKIRVDPV